MTRPQFSSKEIIYDLNNNNIPGQKLFNGTSWDNQYNNMQGTLLSSAVRTATTQTAIETNYNATGIQVILNVTAASGTGGLSLQLRGVDPVSQGGYMITTLPTAVNTTGIYVYELFPGTSGTGANVAQRTSGTLPRQWLAYISHGDNSAYTYSVGYSLIN